MSWIILILSGILEAVWATALGKTEGFTKLWPTVIFGVALVMSMGGLAYAMREIPTGTAYAVWVGIGAALTVGYAMITGDESFSFVRVLLILGLIGCVIGLKLVGGDHA
ncbi:DMT family transporter [Microbacterium aurantiacum]|uniref:DMT family transporter n=1 Tax=Microbacterium aurantiacum TaxID=162393 RepID=UPI003F496449